MNKVCLNCKYFYSGKVIDLTGEFCFVAKWHGQRSPIKEDIQYLIEKCFFFSKDEEIIRENNQFIVRWGDLRYGVEFSHFCYVDFDKIIPEECEFKMERAVIE